MISHLPNSGQMRCLLGDSAAFYKDLLGYSVEQTSLRSFDRKDWSSFCGQYNLDYDSKGVYLPRSQAAVIPEGSELSLFHEFFGHGLFCERSLSGKKLVELERRLLDEEREEFERRSFSLEDLESFRRENDSFQDLERLRKSNLGVYESFAVWSEYFLSREFGFLDVFERKYSGLDKGWKEFVDDVVGFSRQWGDLATFYSFGLERKTEPERVRRLLRGIYGEKSVSNSRLILLTGSKKPFSDIDLFASSNYLQSVKNHWIDLVNFNEEDFDKRVELFEVQITHPIVKGEFVAGNRGYLRQKRRQLQEQPITEKAIQYNFKKAEQERIASEKIDNKELKKIFSSYSQTYLSNALALRGGKRLFSKEDLLLYSQKEKLIELKGGKLI